MSETSTDAMWIDRTGWTWLLMRGTDRIDLLNRLSTNDLTQLGIGKGLQTVLTTDKARMIDVLTVLNDTDRSMVVASPGMGQKIIQWLRTYTITDDVRTVDATPLVGMIELTGSRAADVVQALCGLDVAKFTIGQWEETSVNGQDVYVFRMPPTVELSYWIVSNPASIGAIMADLRSIAGLEEPLTELDVEYLRVMGGIGALGHEWSDTYNPLEAGLLHLTSFTKGCYIGQEIIARLDSYNKVKQRILGFVSDEELHVGDVILASEEHAGSSAAAGGTSVIGALTTITRGLTTPRWYALGYIRGEHAHPGTSVTIKSAEGSTTTSSNPSLPKHAEIRLLPMVEQ